jgi:hypothetical protein
LKGRRERWHWYFSALALATIVAMLPSLIGV